MNKLLLGLFFIFQVSQAQAAKHEGVSFISPKDGATVTSPFKVKFAVHGKKIKPAGEATDDKKVGHHHLLIDTDSLAEGTVVPSDETHKHYGKGQTEDKITLPPGKHKLTLQFADGLHRSYGEKWAKTIEVNVK
jgi:hypothetical protein